MTGPAAGTAARRSPARLALGLTRLAFGTVGLLAPHLPIRRIEGPGVDSSAPVYAFRMFGIRTILLGRDLLLPHRDDAALSRALRQAPLIHAVDTATATLLALSGRVPRSAGAALVAVSGTNTALALAALRDFRRSTS